METFSLESYFIEDYFNDWAVRPDTSEIAQESFTFVSKYLNVITVEEKGNNIHISGINSRHFAKDVKKLWQTSRIVQYMFVKLTSREIVLPKFFAVELRYMLVKLVESGQSYSKRTIKTIIEELEDKTWLKGVVNPPKEEIFNYSRLNELNVTLLPSQMDFLKLYSDIVPRYGLKGFMLASPPGSGKAQPLSAKVKIPHGWKTMGEMQVGDVVTAHDGSQVKVLGVYPQGKRLVYRLTTLDGRVTEADQDHLWYITDVTTRTSGVFTTLELKDRVENGLYLPTVKPDQDIDLEYEVSIEDFVATNPTYIPDEYKDGSYVQRRKLLDLLCIFDNNFEFTASTETLAEDLVYLIRSLGGVCHREGCLLKEQLSGVWISSIEYVGEEETQCILIDHPDHLYITDDFIVTHNTESGLALSLVSEADTTIVIAPKNAVHEVWRDRIIQRFKHTPTIATSVGSPFTGKEKYYICHYEALDRAIQFAELNRGKKICIILDESHNLNEIVSLRTQKFINLCKLAQVFGVLWASGTPLKAMGSEMVPFLSTIDPLFTEDVKARFVQIFGKSVARAVDILANRIGITSFKVAKAAVVELDIDETILKVAFKGAEQFTLGKIKHEIAEFVKERVVYYKANMSRYLDLYNALIDIYRQTIKTSEERKALDAYYRDVMHLHKRFDPARDLEIVRSCNKFEDKYILPVLRGEQKAQFRDSRSVVKYVQLKIRGEALGRILTKRRIECFKAMVEHTDFERIIEASEKKTLIFTSYIDVVDEIADRCFNLEYNPLKVYGDTNKDIEKIMKIYKTDQTANPMVATYDSLSTAIPVVEANTCILFNSPFRDYERNQATSRVARLGQDSPVHIISVLLDTGSEDNISTRSNDIMEWSKQQVDAMLGYDQTVDNFDD